MRQVTGSNQPQNIISISVRLLSSGDPFLIDDHLPKESLDDNDVFLRIELLTKRAILVPKALLAESTASAELSSVGILVAASERVVMVEDRDYVSLIVVPTHMVNRLDSLYPDRYEFTTPLLRRPVSSDPHLLLDVSDGLAVVKIYDGGWHLRFVDIYAVSTTASIVYWMQRLSTVFRLKSSTLYIYRYDGSLSHLLGKHFKKIMHANNKRRI